MQTKTGRYSGYIRPFSYVLDFLILNLAAYYIIKIPFQDFNYIIISSLIWFIIAYNLKFYEVYRYTKVITILNTTAKQWSLFSVFLLALTVFYSYQNIDYFSILVYTSISIFCILIFKLSIYFFLQKFRILFGGNYRKVILFGNKKIISPLENFFIENLDYGYQLIKTFVTDSQKPVEISQIIDFVSNNNIDEIYCSLADLKQDEINTIVNFADNNLKTLKFIPDVENLIFRNFNLEYYDYIPIIALRKIKMDKNFNKISKRIFDLFFSIIIIIGILSWLIPILGIIIKLETKGPIFFKQKRNGLNYKEFYCYKFRSMRLNSIADLKQVQRNDPRVTKTGAFLRKTSIDELPQFFNVLIGTMSVVGPRPHMVSHTEMYAKSVDKFMVRHFIKPGITGLAQINGYRGEVESQEDIINRVKYDIFYLENWSILLDIKIVFTTLFNTIKGDKKAY